jgi:hypothetical protein
MGRSGAGKWLRAGEIDFFGVLGLAAEEFGHSWTRMNTDSDSAERTGLGSFFQIRLCNVEC